MSLRKSPTLTPALLASNRRNAKKSTGPRTAQGKAWSRLSRLQARTRSPEYINFVKALADAPLGQVGEDGAEAYFSSQSWIPLQVCGDSADVILSRRTRKL